MNRMLKIAGLALAGLLLFVRPALSQQNAMAALEQYAPEHKPVVAALQLVKSGAYVEAQRQLLVIIEETNAAGDDKRDIAHYTRMLALGGLVELYYNTKNYGHAIDLYKTYSSMRNDVLGVTEQNGAEFAHLDKSVLMNMHLLGGAGRRL